MSGGPFALLDDLVGEAFKVSTRAQLSVNEYPDFHVALDNAERFLRRRKAEARDCTCLGAGVTISTCPVHGAGNVGR